MKLRTLFFDKTVLRKDITRFAPLWAIYFIGGLLVMLNVADSTSAHGYNAANNVGATITYFSIINLFYAGIAALLLFGDLYNSRLCNALHAMPMRRENWFITHLVSGMLFSLVPNAVGMLFIMFRLESYWYVTLIWMLGMTMQYLFFFGLAVLSCFCVGNRFAMAAVYGILNGASMIAYWFVQLVYQPLLYGVEISSEPFLLLCPIAQLVRNNEMLVWKAVNPYKSIYSVAFGDGWGYLAVLGVLGVALLALSLVMYRRRKLESAGDFIAVSPLAPIFSVVFALCVGAVFAMFGELLGKSYVPYLLVGLVVGWFSGRMLLQRTVKVFSGKNFLRIGILVVAVLLSIGLTKLDPLGITRWVPEADRVASLTVSDDRNFYYNGGNEGELKTEDPEKIQEFIDIHKYIIETGASDENDDRSVRLYLNYTMKDGRKINRSYFAWVDEEMITKLRLLFSDATAYIPYGDWQTNPDRISRVDVDGKNISRKYYEGLLKNIIKDCEAGNMAYSHQFHDDEGWVKLWITITYVQDNGIHDTREVRVYSECKNTIAWLKSNQEAWFTERYGDMTLEQVLGR